MRAWQRSGEHLECLHEAAETIAEVKLRRFHPQGDDSKRGSSTCLHLGLLFVAAKKRRENRALDFQYVMYTCPGYTGSARERLNGMAVIAPPAERRPQLGW
jgi:hypothetical protein